VILDNSTRWNSTFLSITRALTLRTAIRRYCRGCDDFDEADELTDLGWEHLREIRDGLKPFYELTLRSEGHGHYGTHGCIWEALPALEALLAACERGRELYEAQIQAQTFPEAQQQGQEHLQQLADTPAASTRGVADRRPVIAIPVANLATQDLPRQPAPPQDLTYARQMVVYYKAAWEIIDKYNERADEAYKIFAAATLLNPSFRRHYFDRFWT
jgi:hypothetical protein